MVRNQKKINYENRRNKNEKKTTMGKQNKKIIVQGVEISVKTINDSDYISLTDMLKAKDGDFFISDWLRNRNTLEFIGIWEEMNNPNFNYGEFATIKSQAGLNSYKISAKELIEKTNAIGIKSTAGRYGGTYAHKDIAFEFGMWISPAFKLYIIKEYQRLKETESNQYNLEWNVKRILSKSNYEIHTEAVKNYVIPKYSQIKEGLLYADEADLLNLALFGITAKQWRENNPQRVLQGENIRDIASINELIILSNIENLNAILLKNNMSKKDRLKILSETAREQRKILDKDYLRSIKKLNDKTFIDEQNKLLE